MRRIFFTCLLLGAIPILFIQCGNNQTTTTVEKKDTTVSTEPVQGPVSVKEEAVTYQIGQQTMKSYVAFDESRQGPRPIVLILPEWWGLTDYPRMRARMLAEMGYMAMAVDMYGEGKLANNPEEASQAATPFYSNPKMAKERIDAALAKAKTYAQADSAKTVAIGYCFGGSMVLNYAKMGAPVLGVVSFHGTLDGVQPRKGTKAEFLLCHGGADNFVPQQQIDAFKKSMDSANLSYTFKVYEGATHAFTNPAATEKGREHNMPIRYDAAADSASWNDMKLFFERILQ
ncbi:MAG TPA: dienelactone hydrolase family protein [Flavisolibacter sp.]|jgi:dienelactone hydrolase|nr:dienelactone hydrolase family protein [Flavisolibacter sp.]